MKIGILQTGTAPEALAREHGTYGEMFTRLLGEDAFEFVIWDVEHMDFPPDAMAADGWLITGSKHGAYEDHAFIPPLEDLIRAIRDSGRPMIGVCFGHQIIAQALGGKVEKFDGGWSIGPTTYDFGGEELTINAWHQDQVTKLPPGAQVEASSDFCANAAISYGDRIFTVQPHPEHTAQFFRDLSDARGRGVVPDEILDDALARPDVDDGPRSMARRFAQILKRGGPA